MHIWFMTKTPQQMGEEQQAGLGRLDIRFLKFDFYLRPCVLQKLFREELSSIFRAL